VSKSAISVGSWAFIDEDCPMSFSVEGEEVQFEMGAEPAELQILATEGGILKLIDELAEALGELQGKHKPAYG